MLVGFLTVCADPAASQQAGPQNPPPAEEVNSPDAIKARMERDEKALSPAQLKRRRQAIAVLLEKSDGYREVVPDAKLLNAQLGAPWVGIHKERRGFFERTTEVDIFYCAKAELDIPFYRWRTTVIKVKKVDGGVEHFQAIVGLRNEPGACRGTKTYAPFPELEQLRALRRRSLGKAD